MHVTVRLLYTVAINTLFWAKSNEAPLVWISLDALGRSMVTEKNTPFLYKLSQQGSISLEHHPNYITKTFPNHFSAATGLNVEDHQIVGNKMIDPKLGSFSYSNTESAWWNPNGDTYPIWTLNQMHNKLGSAVIYWPGGNVPYGRKNIHPKYFTPVYESGCKCQCRMEKALNKMKSGGYDLVMVYVDDIDEAGHFYGPTSSNFIQTLKNVDKIVENFFNIVKFDVSLSDWNLIISSDHGMKKLDSTKVIAIDSILPNTIKYTLIITGSQGQLNLQKKSDVDTVVKLIAKQNGVNMVVTPATMPQEYKYSKSKRIPDITIIMNEGWAVVKDQNSRYGLLAGDHGYPSKIAPSMIAVFMGYGKDIRKNLKIKKTKMTDLFGIACFILEIDKYCKIDDQAKSIAGNLVLISPKKPDRTTTPSSSSTPQSSSTDKTAPTAPTSTTTQTSYTSKQPKGSRKYRWLMISISSVILIGSFIGCAYIYYCWQRKKERIRRSVNYS